MGYCISTHPASSHHLMMHESVDGAYVPENILKGLFFASLTSTKPKNELTTTKLLSRLPTFIYFLVRHMSVCNPSLPPLFLFSSIKSCLSHTPSSFPPSALLLLPLLPSILQSHSARQSNSCPLTSPITVCHWLFACLVM